MLNVRDGKMRCLSLALLLALMAAAAFAQQTLGILRGTLTDESGALIPAAQLTVTGPNGSRKIVQTQADGTFSLPGLAPGTYTVSIALPGFSAYEAKVEINAAKTQQLNISLKVQAEKQEVTVKAETGPQVSVEPDSNAGALVLRGADLDALPDDPDDLAADLQALAGPAAGPNGGQIFIDGFSGGSLPPKENIREIRINQNPWSAEFDQLGYGRIEILTKPGTDKFHGSGYYSGGSDIFDARNPYLSTKPYYLQKMFEGMVTGPLTKKSSFSVAGERRSIDDSAAIIATGVDPTTFAPIPVNGTAPTPNVRSSISPRMDYALTPNNTVVGRYTYLTSNQENAGLSQQYTLPSRAYSTNMTEQRVQLTETNVHPSHNVVNETRLEFRKTNTFQTGDNTIPSISVQDAFYGGGAGVGHYQDLDNRWEIQNYTTATLKAHTLRFGARLRTERESNTAPNNFNGNFTYAGGIAPILDANYQPVGDPTACANVNANAIPAGCQQITSLQRYQRTLFFNNLGYSVPQMRALGGGPTLFTINGGDPLAAVRQTDVGLFIQDDWRAARNLTISAGMRYETQTNVSDYRDWAPRIGIAWAPGARGGRSPKTVLRAGSGFFYTRFDNGNTLNTLRFNGITEQSYSVVNPSFLTVPSLATLTALPSTTRITNADLRAPLIWQSAIGVERQLPRNTTLSSTFTFSHGTHMFRTRDINAPIYPGGPRPYPGNEIFQYESSGLFNQKLWMVNLNTRVTKNLSLMGFYTLSYSNSNTDGVSTLPANQYNLAGEYGRSSLDSHQHLFLMGNVTAPLRIRFSPYISASSGRPYNVVTGRDFYGDTLTNDRPGIATATTPGAFLTPCGYVNPNPSVNDPRVVRNCAQAPGYFSVNLRMSRTWGFGPTRSGFRGSGDSGGGDHGPGGDHGGRGSRGGGPPGGGGMRMGSSGGMRGFDSSSTEHRFNLTVSASARNLFNHLNPGIPSGNLTSPYFGVATTQASSYGPSSAVFNRRIELSIRLTF